jgi:hypothetical protein
MIVDERTTLLRLNETEMLANRRAKEVHHSSYALAPSSYDFARA